MLDAISRLFRKQSKMQSVDVRYIGDVYYVATEYGAGGSDPCYVVGPVRSVASADGPEAVGRAIFEGLAQCRYDFAAPANREDWKQVQFPLLKATGSKTWAALAKRSNSLVVRRLDRSVTVLPCYREKQGFFPVMERQHTLDNPAETALGELVMSELELARRNEGPASGS